MVINHLEKLFVTSDASTIVSELEVQHPAAKLLVMAAKAQEAEIGDGTNLVSQGACRAGRGAARGARVAGRRWRGSCGGAGRCAWRVGCGGGKVSQVLLQAGFHACCTFGSNPSAYLSAVPLLLSTTIPCTALPEHAPNLHTKVLTLGGELLANAESLLRDGLQTSEVVDGYQRACDKVGAAAGSEGRRGRGEEAGAEQAG